MAFIDRFIKDLFGKWPITVVIVSAYGIHVWRTYKREVKDVLAESIRQKRVINEVVNFRATGEKCEKHIYEKFMCEDQDCPYKKLRCIIEALRSSRKSLDVCIHLLTSVEIADVLVECHERGVKVRFLCDHDMATNKGSQVDLLTKAGIAVRVPMLNYHMHSKMALVDGAKLVTGSVNWTVQGMHGNWDNLVITSHRDLVRDSKRWYELMWTADQTKIFTRL